MAVQSFVFFALAFWPLWIPVSALFLETELLRKRILQFCFACGSFVFIYATAALWVKAPIAVIHAHSLDYRFQDPFGWIPVSVQPFLYFSSTVLPLLVTSDRMAKRMGWLIFASLILAKITKAETLTSSWCFFAAIVSLIIAISIYLENRKKPALEKAGAAKLFSRFGHSV